MPRYASIEDIDDVADREQVDEFVKELQELTEDERLLMDVDRQVEVMRKLGALVPTLILRVGQSLSIFVVSDVSEAATTISLVAGMIPVFGPVVTIPNKWAEQVRQRGEANYQAFLRNPYAWKQPES